MERKLSELLHDLEILNEEYMRVSNEMEDSDKKDEILMDLGLAMDYIDICLMYGDYVNDTGKDYDYYAD